jgi:predicted metal-dependent phosphoesterase TrpH
VIDLHTHSSVSDGRLTPTELLEAAAHAGVRTLALTDHDTLAGVPEAREAAHRHGVRLVPGVEVSTQHAGADIHLLVYWPDPDDPGFSRMLERIRRGRDGRVGRMVSRLNAAGVPIEVGDVLLAAKGAVPGRPHVADALVRAGVSRDRTEAFDVWLAEGRPGHVQKPAPSLHEAIGVSRAAGGVPVVAHPRSRGSREVLDRRTIRRLADLGLVGVEVDHTDHGQADRAWLRSVAEEAGLVVTGSSDFHGAGAAGAALGAEHTDPAAFADLEASRSARSSGAD